MPRLENPEAVVALREELGGRQTQYRRTVIMCAGTACRACGCMPVAEAVRAQIDSQGLNDEVRFRTTGCHGFCEQGPLAIIEPENLFYCHIKEEDVEEVVARTFKSGEVIERLLYTDPVWGNQVRKEKEIPFYAGQERVLLGANLTLSPEDIEDYIAIGGYEAAAKALTDLSPEDVVEEVKASGLRGRGGGGYPTGLKWELCKAVPGDDRYIICNADEGDPGAYMDRSLLEGNPHAVLEGMLIGAYAIGAGKGFIYVRQEYPLAVCHIRAAVEQAREYGVLGKGLFGTDFDFDVKVVRGGGAFVCGEETGLIASIEGRVGEPRTKPPFPAVKGLYGQPTVINNVETWANVPKIILSGAAWFAGKGTETSKGTKIFTLTGQVKNTGLVEIAMGTTLRELVFDIGGGAKNGREIKAVQTGGPSGGCLPVSQFDLPVDFDRLTEVGSMMGSGGLIVMDNSTCMVDIAKYFLTFLQDESCGKCVPCRVGVGRMLEIVTDVSEGRGTMEQLDLLEDLAWTVAVGSLCALGRTAPNPVLSTLKYYRGEYEAHIKEKRCPAAVCRELVHYSIDQEACKPCCADCSDACPAYAIMLDEEVGLQFNINDDLCSKCGICMEVCPANAISKA